MFKFCKMFLTPILILATAWIIILPARAYADTTKQDQQLAKALKYYFDKEYEKALPIFKEIAEREETMDLMFWIGTSAARTGRYELAEKRLKQMLEKDPSFHIARLELADIYIKTGRFDQARKELEKVKAASPPPAIVKNIDRRLAVIEQQSRKLDWSMMLSAGVQYDDNISTGPDEREIPVSGGTVTLTDRQKKLDDFSWLTRFVGDVRYDIGAYRGLVWDTKVHFFNSAGIDYSEFNTRAVDINTGPWWVGPRDIIKIPVGYMDYDYGSDNLSETFHVDPSIEHFFNRFFSMQASYTFADEDYSEEKVAGMDSEVHKFSLGPNLYLQNRRHVISGYYTYEDRSAEVARNSYDGHNITLTYFTKLGVNFPKLSSQPELYLFYRWLERDYKDPPALYPDDRKDRRHTFSVTLSQRFMKHFFASLSYTYMRNNSNAALFDFDKNTYALKVGVIF